MALTSASGGDSEPMFTVNFERFAEVDDHVEFAYSVTHRGGMSWQMWRRFSEFEMLHDELLVRFRGDEKRLPEPPEKSWIPSFAQIYDNEFCEGRLHELQGYMMKLLRHPEVAQHSLLYEFLGVAKPEEAYAVRVSWREDLGHHELEIRPGRSTTSSPAHGYHLQIKTPTARLNFDLLIMDFNAQVHLAKIRHIEAGEHCFTVVAWNCVGESTPVDIVVHVPTFDESNEDDVVRSDSEIRLEMAHTDSMEGVQNIELSVDADADGNSSLMLVRSHVDEARYAENGVQVHADSRVNNEVTSSWLIGPNEDDVFADLSLLWSLSAESLAQFFNRSAFANLVAPVEQNGFGGKRSIAATLRLKSEITPSLAGGGSEKDSHSADNKDDDSLCVICLENSRSHAYIPCGHRCVCARCSDEFGQCTECPICRSAVEQVIRIFT